MNEILIKLNLFFEQYNIFIVIISLLLLIWGMYNKIKYLCLAKASDMIQKIENREDLTGEEKLALCIIWIQEELPRIFRNTLIQTLIKNLINYTYNNSFKFMKNYVKRKTGYDITAIIEMIKQQNKDNEEEN